MKRIHIVGACPRTGTTLLAELMKECFQIDLYTSHESRIWAHTCQDGNIFLTKAPQDILVISTFLRIIPNLWVIYMVRDPRDVIVSKHRKDPDRYWVGLGFWKTYTAFGRKVRGHPQFITLRYEDLVEYPNDTQSFLMERMPFLIKKASFSRFHEVAKPSVESLKALGGVRPISTASIGRWRDHLPRVAGQLLLHGSITQDLIEFGYETDDSWLGELLEVASDIRKSHFLENHPKKYWRHRRYMVCKGVIKVLLIRLGINPSKLKLLIPWRTLASR